MRPPVDRFIEASGLRLHLNEWDGGGDLTLLLLHGYLEQGRTWRFVVEALGSDARAADWHLIAPDWRGHGDSEWVGRGGYYHFPDYVRDLDQVVRAVRRKHLVVVGHSMGAAAAALWAGARPDALDRLVLVEGAPLLGLSPETYAARFAQWLDETAPFAPGPYARPMRDVEHAAQRLCRFDARLPTQRAAIVAADATRLGDDGCYRWRYDPLHRTRSPAPMPPEVTEAIWRRIRCPTLWVGGAESEWRGRQLDAYLDRFPRWQREVLPGAGHMVQHHQPKALAAAIAAFGAASIS